MLWVHTIAATTLNLNMCCVSVDRFIATRFLFRYQDIVIKLEKMLPNDSFGVGVFFKYSLRMLLLTLKNSLRWPICTINPADKTKLSVIS
mgnify:CR=1 FL=1